jgi:hypothetical protein
VQDRFLDGVSQDDGPETYTAIRWSFSELEHADAVEVDDAHTAEVAVGIHPLEKGGEVKIVWKGHRPLFRREESACRNHGQAQLAGALQERGARRPPQLIRGQPLLPAVTNVPLSYSQCEEEDLNLHSFRNQNLNLARLPVSPSSRTTTDTSF